MLFYGERRPKALRTSQGHRKYDMCFIPPYFEYLGREYPGARLGTDYWRSTVTRCCLVLLLCLWSLPIRADEISADIESDTTWTSAGSPYLIAGDILVMVRSLSIASLSTQPMPYGWKERHHMCTSAHSGSSMHPSASS